MTKEHVTVKFEPMGRLVDGRINETVIDISTRENLPIRTDCGGAGKCGKCRVILDPTDCASDPTQVEKDTLSREELGKNVRLACQARVQGPLRVTIPEHFMDADAANGKNLTAATYPVDPLVRRVFTPGAPFPAGENPMADIAEWVSSRIANVSNGDSPIEDPEILRQISSPEIIGQDTTLVVHQAYGPTSLIKGKAPRSLGLAVDIGTTSVAAYLCDMQTGRVAAFGAAANPQRRFGEDVISRISFANKENENAGILQKLVVESVSDLAGQCASRAGATLSDIDEVTVVGNTTMEQVFYGAHPYSLGTAPYMPLTRRPVRVRARDVGLSLNPGVPVYVFPVVSGFVGGDTLGAVLADKPYLRTDMSLLVDIGTNGELVMGNREGLWASSCATGPAFEGAHISCGMRAVPGAVSKLDIDSETGAVTWELVGDGPDLRPMGLCGSGIIDAIAALRRAGIILESGSFQTDMPGVVYDDQGIGREFVLVPMEKTGTGMPISITLGDIRQIQLAKAALATGIQYLVQSSENAVDRIVLTGAFGARFDWRNAFAIGMLPECVAQAKVHPMDNLAGVGAILALLDGNARKEIEGIYGSIQHVDLTKKPDFHNLLTKHMMFPPIRTKDEG